MNTQNPPHRAVDDRTLWLTLGVGALAGAVGYSIYQEATRNKVSHRPEDDAPPLAARSRSGRRAFVGRTVTIAKPRDELFTFWRDVSNLPAFMESVEDVRQTGDDMRWTIVGPAGHRMTVESRIVEERQGELIAWRSTEASEIEAEGRVTFRDAPAGRGTEVEALISYIPPLGEAGRWIAKLFHAEPSLQGRRELKRFKMLMEAGEIATSRNRNS